MRLTEEELQQECEHTNSIFKLKFGTNSEEIARRAKECGVNLWSELNPVKVGNKTINLPRYNPLRLEFWLYTDIEIEYNTSSKLKFKKLKFQKHNYYDLERDVIDWFGNKDKAQEWLDKHVQLWDPNAYDDYDEDDE